MGSIAIQYTMATTGKSLSTLSKLLHLVYDLNIFDANVNVRARILYKYIKITILVIKAALYSRPYSLCTLFFQTALWR